MTQRYYMTYFFFKEKSIPLRRTDVDFFPLNKTIRSDLYDITYIVLNLTYLFKSKV